MQSALLAVFAFVACVVSAAPTPTATTKSKQPQIALSPDVFTGIFAGLFLLGMLIFAIKMLDGIQTSDKIGKNKPELTQ
jgi:hypothetical protein